MFIKKIILESGSDIQCHKCHSFKDMIDYCLVLLELSKMGQSSIWVHIIILLNTQLLQPGI